MEEFITKHLLGVFLTQLVLGGAAMVKLWFNFQTLKRDFDKKELQDEKAREKEEKTLISKLDKIEEQIKTTNGLVETTRKDIYNTDKYLSEQIVLIKAQLDVYGNISNSYLEYISKGNNPMVSSKKPAHG